MWSEASVAPYQKTVPLTALMCWLINLAVSSLTIIQSTLCFVLRPSTSDTWEQGWRAGVQLLPIKHSSNHSIRAAFDDECT